MLVMPLLIWMEWFEIHDFRSDALTLQYIGTLKYTCSDNSYLCPVIANVKSKT
jgi:hypothetical protein